MLLLRSRCDDGESLWPGCAREGVAQPCGANAVFFLGAVRAAGKGGGGEEEEEEEKKRGEGDTVDLF